MNTSGRHIMINCEGSGNEPPVSEEGLCKFISGYLILNFPGIDALVDLQARNPNELRLSKLIRDAIMAYEEGNR